MGGREGSTKLHCPPGGRGRGWGDFRNCPVEFSREERGRFLLPAGRASGTLYLPCWGCLTDPGVSLGFSLSTSPMEESFQAFAQSQLQLPMGDLARGRRRPAGPAAAVSPPPPTPPGAPPTPLPRSPALGAERGARQAGSLPLPAALISPLQRGNPDSQT